MSEKWFTVEVQAGNESGTWRALLTETISGTEEDTAESIVLFVAANQKKTDREGRWRVAVWEGADADTGLPPTYSYEPGEVLASTCRACPDGCKECSREQETCECYTHENPGDLLA